MSIAIGPGSRAHERAPRPAHAVGGDQRGFVLALVIFALAAVSVGASAAFLIVRSESRMADSGIDGARAFQLAHAGLQRYLGEQVGVSFAPQQYPMGGGEVRVRAERVLTLGDTLHLYMVTSEATIEDPRSAGLPARRAVRQLARMDLRGIRPTAAFTSLAPSTIIESATIDGRDALAAGTCPGAGDAIAGISARQGAHVDAAGTILDGDPSVGYESDLGDWQQAVGIDWQMLADPAFPFEYGESWPVFAALDPADYPMIRVDGAFDADQARSGRGLLVVPGEIRFEADFTWDGVIIAGTMADTYQNFEIDGALITGMDVTQGASLDNLRIRPGATVRYNACHVHRAGMGLARLEPVENTWWEMN